MEDQEGKESKSGGQKNQNKESGDDEEQEQKLQGGGNQIQESVLGGAAESSKDLGKSDGHEKAAGGENEDGTAQDDKK